MLELFVIDTVSKEWLGEIEVTESSEILEALEEADYIENQDAAQLAPMADGAYSVLEQGNITLTLTPEAPEDDEVDDEDDDEDEDEFEDEDD